MVRDRCSSQNIKFICGNDDSVYSLSTEYFEEDWEYSVVELEGLDYEVCTDLGLFVHPKKSFYSREWVFFEEYSHPEFREKECLKLMALSKAFLAPSTYWAKQLVSSVFRTITSATSL